MPKKKKKKQRHDIYCPYCGSIAIKRSAWEVYGDNPPKDGEYSKMLWVCNHYPECDAYVTAGRNGKPLGVLADKELRHLRIEAHKYFDEIYKNNIMTRSQAYKLLADRFGLPTRYAHIASFNTYRCNETIKMAREILHNHPKTREWFYEFDKERRREHGDDEETTRNV